MKKENGIGCLEVKGVAGGLKSWKLRGLEDRQNMPHIRHKIRITSKGNI